jgi:hypothetical protein
MSAPPLASAGLFTSACQSLSHIAHKKHNKKIEVVKISCLNCEEEQLLSLVLDRNPHAPKVAETT